MTRQSPIILAALDPVLRRTAVSLAVLLGCAHDCAACNYQDFGVSSCDSGSTDPAARYYDDTIGNAIKSPAVAACPISPSPPISWQLSAGNAQFSGCHDSSGGLGTQLTCGMDTDPNVMKVTVSGANVQFTGNNAKANFGIMQTDAANRQCTKNYLFNSGSGMGTGGWGDPHLTTVDGHSYDFQGAGEFVALRGDNLEIQTRQTPVSGTTPNTDSATGLSTCVSIYTAVAARVGNNRVTYEPSGSGSGSASSMQLKVNGAPVVVGANGIALDGTPVSGRLVQPWNSPDGFEIDYSDGTSLVVTSSYWDTQQKYYLNVNVHGATADKAIYGKVASGDWLPALPDGSSLGPMPRDLHQRYMTLYGTFANAWRVTDTTSLFDYAPGTSTATFSSSDWPRESASSCAIPQQPTVTPIDLVTARAACSSVDLAMRDHCVFDVAATGFTDFAKSYVTTLQRLPGATQVALSSDKRVSSVEEPVIFSVLVSQIVPRSPQAPGGTVQFTVDGANFGSPVALDADGRAQWRSGSLPAGEHRIAANYVPAPWGGFKASASAEETHVVTASSPHPSPWWLLLLLAIAAAIAH